jgi:ketosteroid isomerase-like protein
MPTIAEAEALFTRRRDAWLREDLDGYLDCWADDVTFESPVHRPPIRGRAAYADVVRSSAAAVRPVRFDVLHLAVAGAVVLAEWEIEAAHRGSGARLCWRGMSAAGYRDGRIAWWREYWNPADLAPRA